MFNTPINFISRENFKVQPYLAKVLYKGKRKREMEEEKKERTIVIRISKSNDTHPLFTIKSTREKMCF